MRTLALVLLTVCGAVAQEELPLAELLGKAPAQARDAATWQALHRQILAHYLPQISAGSIADRRDPATEYQFLCWRAARPDAEAERLGACMAMLGALEGELPKEAGIWLLKILQQVGREESVPTLARLADDKDAEIRDCALRALANNPAPAAATALADLLAKAPADRLVERLTAAPPLPSLVPLLARHAASDGDVAVAAIQALGRNATTAADEALRALSPRTPALESARLAARLHGADRLAKSGQHADANAIYRSLFAEGNPETVRCGALCGLLLGDAGNAVALLRPVLGQGSERLQGVAADYLGQTASEETVLAFADALPTLSVAGQQMLLDVFAARGATVVRPAVLRALESPEARVRVAAVQALATLGDAGCVPALLNLVPTEGALGKEARASLSRLAAPGTDEAILADAAQGSDERRVCCVDALIERRASGSVPALLGYARATHDDLAACACKGLGILAQQSDLPGLVELLVSVNGKAARRDAAKATVAVARRCPPGDERTAPLLAALPRAGEEAHAALLGVLGELGGDAAFAAMRERLADPAPAIREAALRALGAWPDAAPAATLLELARAEQDPVRQVLALRGAVRAMAQPGAPPPQEAVAFLRQALDAARRDDERKVALAGLGLIRHRDALLALRPHLETAALRPEAVAAMLQVAAGIAGEDRDLANEYLALVLQHAEDGPLRQQAEETRRKIEQYDGFLLNWLIAGPFFKTAEACDMIDMKMEPEGEDAATVRWQIAPQTGDPAQDWQLLFENIYGGKDRAAYAVAWIRCTDDTQARFEIGSDDGVKVWLDDTVVHANAKGRPLKAGEDVVDVDLPRGWHRITLKVTQFGGHWGACLRVRNRAGGPLAGCRTVADFRDLAAIRADLADPPFAESARRALADIAGRLGTGG